MKRAWMPLYVGDYLGDTGHLTTSQHGAYLLLMMHYWRTGGLPDDDKQLSTITKLPMKIWLDYRDTIQTFFYDGWCHKRIDAELATMEAKTRKRALAGSKGGTQAAINRMNLENRANGRSLLQQTSSNATGGNSSNATAMNHHSHSPSKKERKEERKEGIEITPQLLASLTKKAIA
jgi:uncharacterized protein YdaU (DUF1376 family)